MVVDPAISTLVDAGVVTKTRGGRSGLWRARRRLDISGIVRLQQPTRLSFLKEEVGMVVVVAVPPGGQVLFRFQGGWAS